MPPECRQNLEDGDEMEVLDDINGDHHELEITITERQSNDTHQENFDRH